MTTKTRTDLVAQILANLGVLAAGQTVSVEDSETADDHIDPALAVLEAEGICSVPDLDDIPLELFPLLADYIALDAGPEFGKATDNKAMEGAKYRIRLVTRSKPTYEIGRMDYF